MPARPFTRAQALQNERFLEALRRTGNPRLAADLLGVHRSTYTKRRAKSAAFAQAWDAALAFAHAAFHEAGAESPLPSRERVGRGGRAAGLDGPSREHSSHRSLRTKGGEPVVGRTRGGRLQLRRSPPGRITEAAEQAFLAALAETANIRLSAAAAGFTHPGFYARKRRSPEFAADWEQCAAAARADLARAMAEEAARVAAGLSVPFDPFPSGWPRGLTVAHALRARGMPPLRLPGMGFPKRKSDGDSG